MTLKHIKLQSLDDFFIPLSGRNEKGVYFYRFNKTSEKIEQFIYKYYNEARKSGVVIEGKIGNPTESNLSYYEEIMGLDFQMSMGFISTALKKWLPRMGMFQRENIAGAIYDVLDELRKKGKNENMLKNAYIKFMCWLYYKFESVVNQMNGENIPKILFIGDIVGYEFMLINILADAGCDVVFVQPQGDDAYLKVDASLEKSFEYTDTDMAPFEKDFSVKKLTRKNDLNRWNSNNPSEFKEHILNCTNAWIDGKGIDDFLRPVSVRKNKFNELKNNLQTGNTLGQNGFENTSDNRYADEKNLFYNCYIRINGVWDKLTYENELYQFYLSLQGMKRNVVVVSEMIPKPDTDEIAKIKRGNYRDVYQLVKELQVNIQFPERPSVREFLVSAFADVILDEAKRLEQNTNITNINKILNKAVYLLCFINRYQTALFKGLDDEMVSCFIYMGGCNDENEALFMRFLARTKTDVLILCPNAGKKCCLEDKILYEINYPDYLAVNKFPMQNADMHIGTAAYHAERELDNLMYNDDMLFRNQQYDKANAISLNTMDSEIKILWDTELKYRPGFSTAYGIVNIPVIFSKFSGVKDRNTKEYWVTLKQLMTPETLVIDSAPYILPTDANPMKMFAAEFFKNGRLHRNVIKNHRAYQYGFLREDMQEHILDKIELLLQQKSIKGTFENGTEYTIVAIALNLPKEVTRLLQAFDFTKKNPKLIYLNTSDSVISLEDTIYIAFLNLLGFDVALFVPTGYNMENYFNMKLMEEHQMGDYMYDLQVPNWNSIPLSVHTSLRDRLFRRG